MVLSTEDTIRKTKTVSYILMGGDNIHKKIVVREVCFGLESYRHGEWDHKEIY